MINYKNNIKLYNRIIKKLLINLKQLKNKIKTKTKLSSNFRIN